METCLPQEAIEEKSNSVEKYKGCFNFNEFHHFTSKQLLTFTNVKLLLQSNKLYTN